MSNFITDLASKSGLDSDQAHQGVGALLAHLKDRLDPAAFEQLQKAIPNCDELLSSLQTKMQSAPGGVLAALKSMTGKLIPGADQGASTAVETDSGSPGLPSKDLANLLPQLHEMLANKLPAHVIDQIRGHIPGFGPSTE
jgi:hypothetical protein